MNVIEHTENTAETRRASESSHLDLDTIRRRVAMIKSGWSEETARARAAEGQRRRNQLESFLLDLLTDVAGSEETCDLRDHGFSLVS